MDALFIKIFNLGVTAGWFVLAVLLLRPLMKKAPKWINCLLWGIVGLRLVFPFSLESVFSLIPSAEPLPQNITAAPAPVINSGVGVLNDAINPIISTTLAPDVGASVNPMQTVIAVASWVWVIGIALMLGYGIVSYILLRIKVRVSVKDEDKVYFCDEVDSPFILGVFRPRIYVPSGMRGEALGHVLAHEKAHLRRGDHLWKPVGFTLLALYWFNPLLWIAYALLCRDIEAACDEKVIKTMPDEAKKSYSEALLTCSLHRKRIMACPLAFGEVGVKERIKMVLNYKKPAFWIIIAALVATLVLSVCFLTNPKYEVGELLAPNTAWKCQGYDVFMDFYVDKDGEIHGYLQQLFSNEDRIIDIFWRDAGKNAVADIYISDINRVELKDDYLLLSGIFRTRGEKLIFEVEKDNLGLTGNKLEFEKRTTEGLAGSNKKLAIPEPPTFSGNLYVRVLGYGCDAPAVDVRFIQAERRGDDICFVLGWNNNGGSVHPNGPDFSMFRYEGDEPIRLSIDTPDAPDGVYPVEKALGYGVVPGIKSVKTYNLTECFDIYTPGKYRFECYGAWVEFEVVHTVNNEAGIDRTMLFDISGDGKYDMGSIYVSGCGFQDNGADVYFVNAARDGDDILFKLEWNNRLLKSRTVGPDFEIFRYEGGKLVPLEHISAWKMYSLGIDPLARNSHTYNITEHYDISLPGKYRFECEGAWVDFEVLNLGESVKIYDTVLFDIDGDGEPMPEICTAYYGYTSGVFTFSLSVSEMAHPNPDYYTTYRSEWMDISFVESPDDKLRLQGKTRDGKVRLFDITLRDGNVILSENGEELEFYVLPKRTSLSEEEKNKIRQKYPESCALDASKGLDVYVWQMAKNSYSFALTPHGEYSEWLTHPFSISTRGNSAEAMRAILSTYDIGADKIYVIPWQNPISSYISDYHSRWTAIADDTPYQEMYLAIVRDMILGDGTRGSYPCVYESTFFDIDGDGEKEFHQVCLGLSDGRFMFSYVVSGDGRTAECFDTFYTEPMSLKFFTADGKLRLRGRTERGEVCIYDISIENGHVKLNEKREDQTVQTELDLSGLDLSMVDRIVITDGKTGEKEYVRDILDREGYKAVIDAVKGVKASDPVSNKGHYGFNYHVELYYDYQTVFSFSLCNEPTDAPRIVCGYYETDGGFDYAARYQLTGAAYAKLDEALGKYFK